MYTTPKSASRLAIHLGRTTENLLVKALIVTGALVVFFLVMLQLPYFGDWQNFFYQVAQNPLSAHEIRGFLNAPWMAWILAPFSLLSVHVSGALWMTLSIVVTVWCIHRLGGGLLAVGLCLLSPAFIRFITAGQLDAVPLLGFTLLLTADAFAVRALGPVLMATKPQVLGAAAISYWVCLDRRHKALILLPIGVVFIISLLLNGWWPLQIQWDGLWHKVDVSPWPYGIPIGLLLLGYAIRRQKHELAGIATFFLAPYVSHSTVFAYSAVVFAISPKWLSILVFLLLWAIALLTL